MSLMSSLYTGVSGLSVNQRGLTATAHNLSNVETEGFVRQQIVLSDSYYSYYGMNAISFMKVGSGATVAAVKQERDAFLDKSYRQEYGREMFYEAEYDATTEITDILGETEGVAFQKSVSTLWNALSELCKEPESMVARTSFIQTAVGFIERAEIIHDQMNEYQKSLNTEIQKSVDRINTIASEIKRYNEEIRSREGNGMEHANDLRDQRNVLLDELSGLAKINYAEQPNGVITISMEGYMLVTDDLVYTIDTRPMESNTDLIEPYWPAFGGVPLFNFNPLPSASANTDVGHLKGLVYARGNKVGQYTDIPREPKKEDYIDSTGYYDWHGFEEAYEKFQKDLEEFNMTTDAFVVQSTQAQFDCLIHGIVTTINDILSPNTTVTTLNGKKVTILDTEHAPVGLDPDFTNGNGIFNRKSMDRYEKTILTIEVNGVWQDVEVYQYNEEDPDNNYSLFTLGEIEVNPKILKDPSYLPLSEPGNTGDYSVERCSMLLDAWKKPFATLTPNEYTVNNFDDYYTEMIGALGTRGEKYKNISESQSSLVNSVNNQRQSVMAVSSDEELTNVIKFQQGYNACARYISVVNQMLEHLLTSLGH